MKIKKEPGEIWREYQDSIAYNTQFDLYENVERNNNFYNDRQWEGVNAPDLDKPVFNFLKPVVNYYIAMLISDDIAANVELKGGPKPAADAERAISQEIANILERENMQFKNRRAIRNAAVDGDCCFYNYFDPDAESGQLVTGHIKTDVIDNTNVLFGDPSDNDPQKSPHIIIAYRRLTESVKEEAQENGEDPDEIVPDSESIYVNDDKNCDKNYTTVLLKMWKEKKRPDAGKTVNSVHMVKVTQTAVVKKEWDTDYRLYPVSWMNWEAVKNSYHGIAPLTGKIQNQIFVNKSYAMAMMFVTRMAFPKILFDKTKIPNGWDNRIGRAIEVIGNPNEAIFANFQSADMSASVPNLINSTITQTKELMGANDTALGNVQAENTSAIITVQNQSRLQLDMQRLDFYNCVEGYIRSYIDMMRVHYGTRAITVADGDKSESEVEFDFSTLDQYTANLKVDVGQGSYWSEIMQLQTLDNLYSRKVIPSAVTYLEMLPEGVLKDKQKLIDQIQALQAPAAQAAGVSQAAPVGPPYPPEGQGQANAPRMQGGANAETQQMKQILDELSTLKPEQIVKTIRLMPFSDRDQAYMVDILKRRGVL